MVFEITGLFDFYTLFVDVIFGNFLLSVLGLAIVIMIIMFFFGKIPPADFLPFLTLFGLNMAIGYGLILLDIAIVLLLLIQLFFAYRSYLERAGT